MRTFQQGLLLLLISLSVRFIHAQSPSARLDSLKQVARSSVSVAAKVAALNQIATYYARIPQPDSTLRYCDLAVKMAAADSFQQFMLHVSTNEVMGTLNGVSSNYEESLARYLAAYQNLQEVFAYPLSPREAVMVHQQLLRIENYIGMIYHKIGHYQKSDSIYRIVIRSAGGIPDTAIMVNCQLSRRALYQDMMLFLPKDSAAAKSRLGVQRDEASEAGLRLARTFLSHHSSDYQMQRYLIFLLSGKASTLINTPNNTAAQRKEAMTMLVEAMRLTHESGISGRDLLAAQLNFILLMQDLGRYPKAIELADEVIRNAHALNLPVIESLGNKRRGGILWRQKRYRDALRSYQQGIDLDVAYKDYAEATVICEGLVRKLSALPLQKRFAFRKDIAHYKRLGSTYRQQATPTEQEARKGCTNKCTSSGEKAYFWETSEKHGQAPNN